MARSHASGKYQIGTSPSALNGYTGAQTMAAWTNLPALWPGSGGSYWDPIFQQDGSGTLRGWGIAGTGNNTTNWGVQIVGTGFFGSGNDLSLNTWHHLAISYNGSGTFSFYQDGSFVTTNAHTPNALNSGDQVASYNNGLTGNFLVADRAVWTVVLTTAEIAALAKGARPYTIRRGSLVYWQPVDGLVTIEPDLSGQGNNATTDNGTTGAFGPPIMQFTPRWPQFAPFDPIIFNLMPQIVW
jgi:hypothetical protein